MIPLRSCDSATAGRDEIICPVCGDGFGTYERLAHHVRFNQMIERQEKYPIQDSHLEFEMPDTSPLTLQEVTDHIERTMSEIVVVVEGIDPQLSGTFQAIQSYKYDDIVFGADHERCTSVSQKNKISVDMKNFHRIKYSDEAKHLLSSSSSDREDDSSAIHHNTSPLSTSDEQASYSKPISPLHNTSQSRATASPRHRFGNGISGGIGSTREKQITQRTVASYQDQSDEQDGLIPVQTESAAKEGSIMDAVDV